MGFAPVDFSEWADPAARPDYAKALDTIRSLGVQLTEAKMPEFPYGALIGTIISAEGSAIFEPLIQSGKVDQLADQRQIAGLKAALEIPAKDYLKAMRIRSADSEAFHDLLSTVDVLVSPTRFVRRRKLRSPWIAARVNVHRPTPGVTALIPAGNLAGLPALSLPCGFAKECRWACNWWARRFRKICCSRSGKLSRSARIGTSAGRRLGLRTSLTSS